MNRSDRPDSTPVHRAAAGEPLAMPVVEPATEPAIEPGPGIEPAIAPGPDPGVDPAIVPAPAIEPATEPGPGPLSAPVPAPPGGPDIEPAPPREPDVGIEPGVDDGVARAAAAMAARLIEQAAERDRPELDPLLQLCAALRGRHVAVVGLGVSGFAMARWLAREGARITVLDDRAAPPHAGDLRREIPSARLVLGPFDVAALDGVELVCWSPGLSPFDGPAAALHRDATAAGLAIVGELELFAAAIAVRRLDGYRPRIVAITGTNGKTTVTELMAQFAATAGLDAQAAGNIGPSLLDALSHRLDEGQLPQFWALELSSFQLAFGDGIDCHASVILNVTQDHLDWHPNEAHYAEAKHAIHRRSACWVVNADDPATDPLARFATPARPPRGADRDVRRAAAALAREARVAAGHARVAFGSGEPVHAGDFGIVDDAGLPWLAHAAPEADGPRRAKGAARPFSLRRLMPAEALLIRGAHNRANALAALALGNAAGLPMAAMLRALQGFRAAPHRCAPVLVLNEVEYLDDSKGTNVGATVAALDGLQRRCVLIAGGLGKGQDFGPLAAPVRRHARAVVLIGRDAPAIRAALGDTGVELIDAPTLPQAVREAAARAHAGDVVLLSPACASMDMFRNYAHRADVFAQAVRELAAEAGQPC